MPVTVCHSRACEGLEAPSVTVEAHIANGLPSFQIVGLPETAVREARDRVRAAIQSTGWEFPARRITVNLAPADLPKSGGRYDLGIAVGVLAASGQIPVQALAEREFVAELGLDGSLRSVGGAIPTALACSRSQRRLVAALDDALEGDLVHDATIEHAASLAEVLEALHGRAQLPTHRKPIPATDSVETEAPAPDLADVRGQPQARRALEIAAAGGHHLLMIGPPGSGKSMLAARLPGLLPPLSLDQALEVTALHSYAGVSRPRGQLCQRPFREPHHTASSVALAGGGSGPRPGEVSLAHHGVLFLDELTEFPRRVLDVLREPLETGAIQISRATRSARFPARFQLIAAMNPCPQGFDCDLGPQCQCTSEQRRRHRSRISAPLLDRIDLSIGVTRVPPTALRSSKGGETSARVRERIELAHKIQLERQAHANAQLDARGLERHAPLSAAAQRILDIAADRFRLSARAYHRAWRVARSISDLGAVAAHLSSQSDEHRARPSSPNKQKDKVSLDGPGKTVGSGETSEIDADAMLEALSLRTTDGWREG